MESELEYIAEKTFGFNGQKKIRFNPNGGLSEDEFYKSRRNFLRSYISQKVQEDTPVGILCNRNYAKAFGYPEYVTWYAIDQWVKEIIDTEYPDIREEIDVPSLIVAMRKRARWAEGKVFSDLFDEE